jgi:tetratricopeptide (TPR) repeat protein
MPFRLNLRCDSVATLLGSQRRVAQRARPEILLNLLAPSRRPHRRIGRRSSDAAKIQPLCTGSAGSPTLVFRSVGFHFGSQAKFPIERPRAISRMRGRRLGASAAMNSKLEVAEVRRNVGRPLSDEARQLFDRAGESLKEGIYGEALSCLRRAVELAPDHAQLRSLLGVAIAHALRDFEESRALCESAAKQEFFNPDLYLNLSRVYLEFGRRSEALRYLRRGQMIDPGHVLIHRTIAELGRRRTPIVPFLPRRHPVNRALGTARNLVMSPFIDR